MRNIYFIFSILSVFTCCFCKSDIKEIKIFATVKADTLGLKKYSSNRIIPDTNKIKIINGTFLGNEKRNFYGVNPPSELKEIWKFFLGNGQTRVGSKSYTWAGAGWTGQPLIFTEDAVPFLIQGAYDHHLRKINILTGKEIWKYEFDDVIKSTGSIWINKNASGYDEKYMVMQGSRQGYNNSFSDLVISSFRAVSLITGKVLWKLNSKKTDCYSRDVDGSALILNDTAYIGLENGIFTTFNPNKKNAKEKDGILQPEIFQELMLYSNSDKLKHGSDLVSESSPVKLGNRIYVTSGSGHIYGYNLITKKIDWDFFTGSDINGSPNVTDDSCLIVSIEKQFIAGRGGALKLNPAKNPEESVVWFFPTEDKKYAEWLGGIIGSTSINDYYNKNDSFPHMAAFIGTDGYLCVVEHTTIKGEKITGFDNKTKYETPKLLFKQYIGASISTPIFAENKLIACTYTGINLFEFNYKGEFRLIDKIQTSSIEATPVVYNHRIFIASRDGFLYCYGDDSITKAKPSYLAANTEKSKIEKNITQTNAATKPVHIASTENIAKYTSKEKGKFYLIAGSFGVKSNAEKFFAQKKKEGFSPQILTPDQTRNMVSIGVFQSKEEALKEQSVLKQKGIDVWIY